MKRRPIQIDRDKLRAEVRKLRNESVVCMLDDAIELLPQVELHRIAKKYLDLKRLPDPLARETVPNPFGGRNSILKVADSPEAAHLAHAETLPLKQATKQKAQRI